MNSLHRIWWLFGLLAIVAGPLLATELTGKVVGISDGDGGELALAVVILRCPFPTPEEAPRADLLAGYCGSRGKEAPATRLCD